MNNPIIAIVAVCSFIAFMWGYSVGWRQRGRLPLPDDMRCERHRREVGLQAKIGCKLCDRGPCLLGIGEDLEQRARRAQ